MSLESVRVVLVRPKSSGNVGAVARAMKNLGVSDLVLVAPRRFRRFPAAAMAVHAADLLDAMRIEATLEAAIGDCGRVLGTTCRRGSYRRRALTPREAAAEVVELAARNRIALVLGPEDDGLSNEELRLCHDLVTIPAHGDYCSFNVAQAALLCLYEIFVAKHAARPEPAELATSAELEPMYAKLKEALVRIGFLHGRNPDHIMFALRRMFGRARLEERDVRIWLGIARQIEWFADGGREVAEEKRRRGLPLK